MTGDFTKKFVRERRRLFKEWNRLNRAPSAQGLLGFQNTLAAALIRAEQTASGLTDASEARRHMTRLRLHGDALAWQILHPHAIRQLAKNAPGYIRLSDQSDALTTVFEIAEDLVSQGQFVIVSDLTNVIRIGDLIWITHPETPTIIECKSSLPHPAVWKKGRLGRQISRSVGTARYLADRPTHLYGEPHPRAVIQTDHEAKRNWRAVRRSVSGAVREGHHVVRVSDHECFWAYQEGHLEEALREVNRIMPKKNRGFIAVGSSLRCLEEFDGLYPPPLVWPIPSRSRLLLQEEKVVLGHLIDVAALQGCADGVRIEIQDGDYPVVAKIGSEEYRMSGKFIDDVLYGYETVGSYLRGVAGFAKTVATLDDARLSDIEDFTDDVALIASPKIGRATSGRTSLMAITDRVWRSFGDDEKRSRG